MATCGVPDCGRSTRGARQLCVMHESRYYQTGTTDAGPKCGSAMERFWRRFEVSESGCWIWSGSPNSAGYGQITHEKKQWHAHRFAWTFLCGPIPPGMQIDHRCHVRLCVNPDHLQLATPKMNTENFGDPRGFGSSGVRGVHWSTSRQRWVGSVKHGGKTYRKRFVRKEDAADWVLTMRLQLHTNNLVDRGISA